MLFFAGQASQRIAATESLTTGQDGGLNSPCAVMQGNNEAATAGSQTYNGDSASDSGFFETSDSATPRIDYKDFQLFHDDLPAIDPDIDRFFADADASCQSQDITFHTEVNGSGVGLGNRAPGSNLPAVEDDFFHAINQVDVTAVSATGHEARKDCEIRPQSTDISAPPTPSHPGDVTIDPLRLWIGTYLRHEHIAYQLLQQPQKPLATSHPIPDRRPA